MNKIFNEASKLESLSFELEDLENLMELTIENLADEACLQKEDDEEVASICLFRRIPMYLSVFSIALERVKLARGSMTDISNEIYDIHRKEK